MSPAAAQFIELLAREIAAEILFPNENAAVPDQEQQRRESNERGHEQHRGAATVLSPPVKVNRKSRLYVRLRPEDHLLLRERAVG